MRSTMLVGLLLIAVGILSFAFGGITYTRDRNKAEIGPLSVSVEEKRTIPLPPVVGSIALVGGLALLVAGSRQEQ